MLALQASLWLLRTSSVVHSTCAPEQPPNGTCIPSLIEITLEHMEQGLKTGMFSSVDLVNAYVARIKEVNSTLHMVTKINPDALSIATSLDGERAQGKVRGPLHGVPIVIKNNIATNDLMNNTGT